MAKKKAKRKSAGQGIAQMFAANLESAGVVPVQTPKKKKKRKK